MTEVPQRAARGKIYYGSWFQGFQTRVACPYALGHNIMTEVAGDRGASSSLARQEAERE